jgi:hypothetical protein
MGYPLQLASNEKLKAYSLFRYSIGVDASDVAGAI